MTDNEIFANEILCIRRRACGRCNGGTDCESCDLLMNETEIIEAYQRAMKQNDLIKRQKAEIERLEIELQAMRGAANSYKAEVERLQNVYPCKVKVGNRCEVWANSLDDYDKFIGDVSAEGIKEFWEELKARNTMDRRIISVASGDNLVKAMTEQKG